MSKVHGACSCPATGFKLFFGPPPVGGDVAPRGDRHQPSGLAVGRGASMPLDKREEGLLVDTRSPCEKREPRGGDRAQPAQQRPTALRVGFGGRLQILAAEKAEIQSVLAREEQESKRRKLAGSNDLPTSLPHAVQEDGVWVIAGGRRKA